MRAFQKERFVNAVCYFAKEHSRRTGRPAFQTYIYKYIALFDFAVLEQEGQPAFDIPYYAYQRGPVPKDLYSKKEATSHYEFLKVQSERGEERYVINPLTDPDLDYFSSDEVRIMDGLLDEFAKPDVTTDDLITATHERIEAWKVAWDHREGRERVPMRYEDTFSDGRAPESAERYSMLKEFEHNARRRCRSMGAV